MACVRTPGCFHTELLQESALLGVVHHVRLRDSPQLCEGGRELVLVVGQSLDLNGSTL